MTIKIPTKIEQAIAVIAADNCHGSSWLSRQALVVLAEAAEIKGAPGGGEELAAYLRAVALRLRSAQPTMSSLSNHLVRALSQMPGIRTSKPGIGKLDKLTVRSAVEDELASQRRELTALGEYGAKLLAEKFPGKTRLITLSASDAVFEILSRLSGGGLVITVAESRPVREGADFAVKLAKLGFEVRLVTDAMLGIETVGADCVLTGADAVYNDGSVINKAGTRLLALAAKMDKVPFYCCTQTIKISTSQKSENSSLVPSQRERDPDEIQQNVADGIVVNNLYFDKTEYFLVGGFISENGFLRVKEIGMLSDKAARLEKRVLAEH